MAHSESSTSVKRNVMGQYFTAVYRDNNKPTGVMIPDSFKLYQFAYFEESSMQKMTSTYQYPVMLLHHGRLRQQMRADIPLTHP